VVNGVVKYIPGSNLAKGTSFLVDLCVRINTEVINGISSHTVKETLTQRNFELEEYLVRLFSG
jgi:hypothetical protein